MPRIDADTVVTLSVVDRLLDREPSSQVEAGLTRAQSVRALKGALRRDLEWLLNTRRIVEPEIESFAELNRSLYNYGLPDFTTLTLAAPKDRVRLLRYIESTIATFEPRLTAVKVTLSDVNTNPAERLLRFQIEGLLKMDPAPEQVSFDTVLQLSSGEYEVKGDRGA
jgi:type VI secretion system protein ImpF